MTTMGRRWIAGAAVLVTAWLVGQGRPAGQAQWAIQTIAPASTQARRDWSATIDGLVRDGSLRRLRIDADRMLPGRTHERLQQYIRGVRIWGGDVVRQMNGPEVVSIAGTLYTNLDVDPVPALSASDARAVIARVSGSDPRSIALPELVVLPRDNAAAVLTYQAEAWAPAGPTMYFVDARDGAIVWQYSNLQTQSAVRDGRGVLSDQKKVSMEAMNGQFVADDLLRPPTLQTYDMHGDLTRAKMVLSGALTLGTGDLATSTTSPWLDGAGVDAHTYQGWTYDYYYRRFGRHGLDDHDGPIVGLVHPVNREDVLGATLDDLFSFYLNAFWDGVGRRMVYGDGLPPTLVVASTLQHWTYLAGALDIVGHELTHGVTQFTSNLVYLNESGALNEAFSDIMGTSIEFFYAGPRGRAGNYVIGEDVVTPGGLRSMANPLLFGDPDHYSLRYTGAADNGGVHTNSGIANNAFYLAIEGGTNHTSGLAVSGVGPSNREQIERVFYRAFTEMLPSTATFATARQATIQAATDLYGSGSPAERAVTQAWTAVGVN